METNPNEIVRVHIRVKGRVQGVGFRAHVEYAALQIGVLGWVRNVGRDTVEAVAEGAREQVEQFVESVKRGYQSLPRGRGGSQLRGAARSIDRLHSEEKHVICHSD